MTGLFWKCVGKECWDNRCWKSWFEICVVKLAWKVSEIWRVSCDRISVKGWDSCEIRRGGVCVVGKVLDILRVCDNGK